MRRFSSKTRCVGILTSGGDCPGLNAAIRGIAKAAIQEYGIKVVGIQDGFRGLVENRTLPLNSHDLSVPRHTFWHRVGTKEWVQYDFAASTRVKAVEVYWFDDRKTGGCLVPESWRLLYRDGDKWKPVTGASPYGVEVDRFNRVAFDPVETNGLRIELKLQEKRSGGVLEWRVN